MNTPGSAGAIYVARRIWSKDAIDVFADLMQTHGVPEYIRSDNGPEMVAKRLWCWLARLGTETIYITPGSPWANVTSGEYSDAMSIITMTLESTFH